jgi:hypothetical protein
MAVTVVDGAEEANESELEMVVFGSEVAGSETRRRSHLATAALQVLASYCELLPDAVSAARLDPYRLPAALDASTCYSCPAGVATTQSQPAGTAAGISKTTPGTTGASVTAAQASALRRALVRALHAAELGASANPGNAGLGPTGVALQLVPAQRGAGGAAQHNGSSGDASAMTGSLLADRRTAPSEGPLSAAMLMPLLQLGAWAPEADVRAVARQLLLHKLQTSGIFTLSTATTSQAADTPSLVMVTPSPEMLAWVACLPSLPLSTASLHHEDTAQHSQGTIDPAQGASQAQSHLSAPLSFLCDALVAVSRRPHEAFELHQTLVSQATHTGAVSWGLAGGGSEQLSPLVCWALRSCLKVLSSARMHPEAKAAIATYTCGECIDPAFQRSVQISS